VSKPRQVYLLDSRTHHPETIAVAFARTSRSPLSFREIAAELTDEKSAEFHEKWVVGYGHASVAEHAVLHIALENISRLAVETIESGRLASYTEKSTRYQKWDSEAFYSPPELVGHPLLQAYTETCRALFAAYGSSLEQVTAVSHSLYPRDEGENEAAYQRRLVAQSRDVCRFLLPAASLANVGMTANARAIEHTIQKMLSSPLQEVRELGSEVKGVAQAEIPTLVKYADRLPYLVDAGNTLADQAARVEAHLIPADWCTLLDYDPQGEEMVLAAALYRYGRGDLTACREYVHTLSEAGRRRLADALLGGLGEHDIPLRELEHTQYTFDLLFDQGAFCEAKRHRMMTQTAQMLTADLGYAVPRLLVDAGVEGSYRSAMDLAQQTYQQLAGWNPHAAAYIVPNGFNRRVLMTLNLREAFHFCSLRAAPKAHFSIRRVALRMAEEISARHPNLGRFIKLPAGVSWQAVECQYFNQV
jgi:thymidylate synthase ThyX